MAEQIIINKMKISLPTTITAAALCLTAVADQNQIPFEYHSIPDFNGITGRIWEEQYIPQNTFEDNYKKIDAIHEFALNLLQQTEDIPEEFAKVINQDFWEII